MSTPGFDRYMPQLDGLRALAILSVMVWHYLDPGDLFRGWIAWGWVGVRLFFVLSGFLITGILIRCRREIETGGLTVGGAFFRFYTRRVLRIFPIYYVYVLATAFVFTPMRDSLAWFLTYMQGFLFASQGRLWPNGHLWTLAVEEQFYMFWPLMVLLLPWHALRATVVGLIVLGPVFRLLLPLAGFNASGTMALLPSNLDTLSIGALLAMAWAGQAPAWFTRRSGSRLGFVLGVALFAGYVALHNLGFTRTWEADANLVDRLLFGFADLGAALVFVRLIDRAARGITGAPGMFLAWAPVRFVGKVSYGLYVYHVHVPTLFLRVAPEPLVDVLEQQSVVRFLVYSALSMTVATLSWYAFELPILRLKRHFRYGQRPAVVQKARA